MEWVLVWKKESKNNQDFRDTEGALPSLAGYGQIWASFGRGLLRTVGLGNSWLQQTRDLLQTVVLALPSVVGSRRYVVGLLPGQFSQNKDNTQISLGASSSEPIEDDDEANESDNPSDDEEDEVDAQNTIPMDAFQKEMQTAFEKLRINQEVQGMQLTEIVESTCRYADELAHQRPSIGRQEVILARLCQRFMPDQGSNGGGDTDFGPR
ncbi:hypothetical protein M9H77_30071 [Catharanthus roseus]|uniref:Uncharacterized protein n=1 Tax=Catharanthus roseus TaxID=4058 RepID=A0ACB9ZWK1_CATRO|nr:hypothetical protein M9H77_30071 [Catharanthus roseus]